MASESSDEENWAPFDPHEDGDPRSLAPFVSTPLARVQEAVTMAGISATDVVCDLGCGDARMLLHLHALTGARCVGYEINAEQLEAANSAVAAAGVRWCCCWCAGVLLLVCWCGGDVVLLMCC